MDNRKIWKCVIEECRAILVENLDPDQFLDHLQRSGLSSNFEYQVFHRLPTPYEKLRYLLDAMVSKDCYWDPLLEYLNHHGQTHIAQKLLDSEQRLQSLAQETEGEVQEADSAEIATWREIRSLGWGAFGEVVLCSEIGTGREFAMKRVLHDSTNPAHAQEINCLQKEISVLQILQHPRIVQYLGSNTNEQSICIFLEYMDGGSLKEEISRSGVLTEALARKYSKQMLEGLAYLHEQKLIHRDIKSENILRDSSGNIKIADFGISKRLQTMCSQALGTFAGTPCYMAPEIINGEEYGPKADIWSFACTVVEMLTGSPPWIGLKLMVALTRAATEIPSFNLPAEISPKFAGFLPFLFVMDPTSRPSAEKALEYLES